MSQVLICTSSFSKEHAELSTLNKYGIECVFNPYKRRMTSDEVGELLKGNVVGTISGLEKISSEVLEQSAALKVISRCGIGSDNIDTNKAKEKGVEIFITPDAPTEAVAELTLGLILSGLRKLTRQHNALAAGNWSRQQGSLLSGKSVGLIGFGRIGQRVAKLLSAFGAVVSYYDIQVIENNIADYEPDLQKLVSNSDIISLHTPVVEATKNMVNASLLGQMKEGVLLINTARGELINEADLTSFLRKNKQSFAALDVFRQEPYQGKLCDLPNVLLTPHVGSFAKEARLEMERQALENLIMGLKKAGVIVND